MPRLSDKHIAAIRAAAEDNDQTYGFGDVILLCDELQKRRAAEGPWTLAAEQVAFTAEDSNERLLDWLIARVNNREGMPDAKVLELLHALRNRGYFQTTCLVDMQALKQLLYALSATEHPHIIREIQATRGLPRADGDPRNPIDQLIVDMQAVKNASA